MAKKETKKKKEEKKQEKPIEEPIEQEKYPLIELVFMADIDQNWLIYNLSRKGLLAQFEQELAEYGKKEITPTLTIEEFEAILQGKQ